jgi:hypothetical protein
MHAARCSVTGGNARSDLAAVCGVFEAAEHDFPGRSCNELNDAAQAVFAARVRNLRYELCNPGIISAWLALGNVALADKYRLMKEGGAEQGVPDWTCPAMERCFGSIKVPQCTPTGARCGADDFCCFGGCDGGTCQCLALGQTCLQATDCCKGLYCNRRDSHSTELKCRGDRGARCATDDDCALPEQCEGSTHRCR